MTYSPTTFKSCFTVCHRLENCPVRICWSINAPKREILLTSSSAPNPNFTYRVPKGLEPALDFGDLLPWWPYFRGKHILAQLLHWLSWCLSSGGMQEDTTKTRSTRQHFGSASRSNETDSGCCGVPDFIELRIKPWSLWVFYLLLLSLPVKVRRLVFHRKTLLWSCRLLTGSKRVFSRL